MKMTNKNVKDEQLKWTVTLVCSPVVNEQEC